MAHIRLPENALPGIRGLFAYRPETAAPLKTLAEVLLRTPSSLSPGERELIATFVSRRNDCTYCTLSHAAFAGEQLDGGAPVVDAVCANYATAPISNKLRALLAIAEQVQRGGKHVTEESVARARAAGATDLEIHDTVLIAATFCMFNRYVDGLGTWTPTEMTPFVERAKLLIEHGYVDIPPTTPSA
jgi:uncharacterized peroxidase-related enzyme